MRIHDALVKLGIAIGRLLYGLLIMGRGRRQILWLSVTAPLLDESGQGQIFWPVAVCPLMTQLGHCRAEIGHRGTYCAASELGVTDLLIKAVLPSFCSASS
jgi:hypothetical protein